jgi:hypothetical protein
MVPVLPDGIFKPKITNWVKVRRSCIGICTYVGIFGPFCLLYCQMVYFMAIWYVWWPFGIFFPYLASCTEKNLATLLCSCYSQTPHWHPVHSFFMNDPNLRNEVRATGHWLNPDKSLCVHSALLVSMVARWFIFKPKIPIWVNFGGPCKLKCWYLW